MNPKNCFPINAAWDAPKPGRNAVNGEAINGTNEVCYFAHNKTGSWSVGEVMSFNGVSGEYELESDGGYLAGSRDGMPSGEYFWNVSCYNDEGYENLSRVDFVNVSEYPTSLVIENSTDSPSAGVEMMFYANYTSDLMNVSGVGLNRSEIGRVVWGTGDLDDNNNTYALSLADIDEDGFRNEIVIVPYGEVRGYYANGSLSWVNVSSVVDGAYEVYVADLDNDLFYNDIIIGDGVIPGGCGGADTIKVFDANNGRLVESNPSTGYCNVPSVGYGDFDGDGLKNDLAVVDYRGGLKIYNSSDGTTWSERFSEEGIGADDRVFSEILDINDDGVDDVLFKKDTESFVRAYSGNNGSSLVNFTIENEIPDFAIGDLNENGEKDVVMFSYYNGIRAYYLNGTEYWSAINPGDDPYQYEIEVFDEDEDGLLDDFVVGADPYGSGDSYIRAYNNDKTELWSYTLEEQDEAIYSLSVWDIDSDGKDEIVAGSSLGWVYVLNISGELEFKLNLSHGSIGKEFGESPGLVSGDFNRDGVLDIGVASEEGYLNTIQEVGCIARFSDSGEYDMEWNVSLNKWEINKTFGSTGVYEYNVSCSKGGYEGEFLSSGIDVIVIPNITNVTDFNENLVLDGDVVVGENVTINVTLEGNYGIDKVWVKVWEGAVGVSTVIYEGFLSLIGSFWTVTFGTDPTFGFGDVNYTVYANNTLGDEINESGNFTVVSSNVAPYNPVVSLNSSDGSNKTLSDLNCLAMVSDDDGDNLDVWVGWYKGGVLNMTVMEGGVSNGTDYVGVLGSGNTTKGEYWNCSVMVSDGSLNSSWVNSSNLTILNSLPVVTLISPTNWNATTNRSLELVWSGFDADGDSLVYEYDIVEGYFAGDGTSCDDARDADDASANYSPSVDWKCLYDNGYYYNWTVRANDSEGWGDWASVWHFNVTAEIGIVLISDEINFGNMNPGDANDTDGSSLDAFELDNDGNVDLNVSINSSALWSAEPGTSVYYQVKANNVSGEEGAFDWLKSLVSWFNMPIMGQVVVIENLSYEDGDDGAEIDIRLDVPVSEDPGVKQSTIVFTGALGE